jgi:hypothetical protein
MRTKDAHRDESIAHQCADVWEVYNGHRWRCTCGVSRGVTGSVTEAWSDFGRHRAEMAQRRAEMLAAQPSQIVGQTSVFDFIRREDTEP